MEEDIVNMNLEIPYVAQFLNSLEKHGITFDEDIRTVDQAFEAVNGLKGGK